MAAGVRIFAKNAAPSTVTTAPAGKQPPQAASTLVGKAPSIRSPPIETPAPVPVVRLPPFTPSIVKGTTQQIPPSEETTKSRHKSVRFAEVHESIFGAQVDQAPVGTPVLYAPPVMEVPTPSVEAKGSYLDELLGLEIEPDIPVEEAEDNTEEEPKGAESQNDHQQQGHKENKNIEEPQMERGLKNIQYILASLRATGLASNEIIAYYEDRASAIKDRMGAETILVGENAEAPSAEIVQMVSKEVGIADSSITSPLRDPTNAGTTEAMTDLATTSSLRDIANVGTATPNKIEDISTKPERLNESNDDQRSILGERNITTSFSGNFSSQIQPEPRTASKLKVQINSQANISPLGLPPRPVIDLRASLWQATVERLPPRRVGGLRGAWEQLPAENLIGEHVLPGRPDRSQATRPTANAGTPLNTVVTGTYPTASSTPTSVLATGITGDSETPTSSVSRTVQRLSNPMPVATSLPLASTTSTSIPDAHYDKAKAETSTSKSTADSQEQQSTRPVTEPAGALVPTTSGVAGRVESTIFSRDYANVDTQLRSHHNLLVAGQNIRDQGDPNIAHSAHSQPHAHQSTTATSLPSISTTQEKGEATPSQVKSIGRPNITGRVFPNIPDNAITRQYAGLTSLASPTASTVAAVHTAADTSEPTTVSQVEDSLKNFHITGSLHSSHPQIHTASRQSQPVTANTTLASSIHQSQDNTRTPRRGTAPMLSPFLQSLQNTIPLPSSGVGSATWLQYNQGPAPAAKDRPASGTGTSSEPAPTNSEAHASVKDAWGRVRRAGN